MQLGLLGALLGLPQGALLSGQEQGSTEGAPDLFSQLLGDAGQNSTGQQSLPGGQLLADISPAALAAQEVGEGEAAARGKAAEALQALLGKEISADDATKLLEKFDALAADLAQEQAGQQTDGQGADAQQNAGELLSQLKVALLQIKHSGTSQTVGQVLTQLPALQQAQIEHAPVVERVIALVKEALAGEARQKEAQRQDDAGDDAAPLVTTPSVLLHGLQAANFRAADTAEAAAQEDERKDKDIIEIVPLSVVAQAPVPAWVQRLTEAPTVAAEDAIEVAGATAPALSGLAGQAGYNADNDIPGLDEALPATTAKEKAAAHDALPNVALPKVGKADKPAAAAFRDALNALPDAAAVEKNAAEENADTAPATAGAANTGGAGVPLTSEHRSAGAGQALPHTAGNHAPVGEQVHVALQRATKEGVDELTIQLDPIELGRVEVKLSTHSDGQTHVSFVVDKPETLDSLARDAHALERALQEAGVKADAGSMQFNLRQQPQGNSGAGQHDGQGSGGHYRDDGKDDAVNGPQSSAAPVVSHYSLTLKDGVDIRA